MSSRNASSASEQLDAAGRCAACGHDAPAVFATLWPVNMADASGGMRLSMEAALIREGQERIANSVLERPASVDLLLGVADELMRERRLREAEHLLDRAVAMAPDEFSVRLRRGECLAAAGRYREAFLDLERARTLKSHDIKTIAYHQELHRWVSEQMARKQPIAIANSTASRNGERRLTDRLARWFWRRPLIAR